MPAYWVISKVSSFGNKSLPTTSGCLFVDSFTVSKITVVISDRIRWTTHLQSNSLLRDGKRCRNTIASSTVSGFCSPDR
jgi:hypothetical protein